MYRVERLAKTHNRNDFDCGTEALNNFLRQAARQHADRELSRTFVLIDDKNPKMILGYFTLTVCEVLPERIPARRLQLYPHPIPAAKLARIAVDSNYQRGGLGKLLLMDAMNRILTIAEDVGLIGMFVDAKDTSAANYYSGFGFLALETNPLQLFLPTGTIRKLFS